MAQAKKTKASWEILCSGNNQQCYKKCENGEYNKKEVNKLEELVAQKVAESLHLDETKKHNFESLNVDKFMEMHVDSDCEDSNNTKKIPVTT